MTKTSEEHVSDVWKGSRPFLCLYCGFWAFIALIFPETERRTETYSEPCQTSKMELFAKIA